MRTIHYIIIAFILTAFCSCGKKQSISDENEKEVEKEFKIDFSLFYNKDSVENKYIYDCHRNVAVGQIVTTDYLDSLFGKPFVCNTEKLTSEDWSVYEQEGPVLEYLSKERGDTLVMMRRLYGEQGDWIIWVNLEITKSDSLRVINFFAYDNSVVEI